MSARASGPVPPPSPRAILSTLKGSARRALGQHFLIDDDINDQIAREAGPFEETDFVEIGPGPGGLTQALLRHGAARVTAIERDHRFIAPLARLSRSWPGRLQIVHADALSCDYRSLVKGSKIRIAANLPYNIGTRLIVDWLCETPWPPRWQSICVLLQREVARRLCARPGGNGFGRLSVLCGWRGTARILFDIDPSAFTPPPRVTSCLVRLEPALRPLPCDRRRLEELCAVVFAQRRKMLRTSLRSVYEDSKTVLEGCGIDPRARPEQLGIADFVKLANVAPLCHKMTRRGRGSQNTGQAGKGDRL